MSCGSPSAPCGVAAARVYALTQHKFGAEMPATIYKSFRLDGRVALVTGANGGLGLEMVLVLAELGAKVWGSDLHEFSSDDFKLCAQFAGDLYEHQKDSEPNGKVVSERIVYRQADVTDELAINAVVQEIIQADGRLDICIAAAGILPLDKSCLKVSAAEFNRVMETNTTGVFNTAVAAARYMEKLNISGSIILVASMSGSITNRDHHWVAYNSSKSAVIQMARSMACELGLRGIRVNTLSPGHIRTPMTAEVLDRNPGLQAKWSSLNPLGRIGRPDEIRGVIAWLASDASSFCTGSDILVSGGHHAW